jgi:outer membrane immunogenic protein
MEFVMRKYVFAALLAGTVAFPAMAQNASPFTGPRVEGLIGYDSLRSGEQEDDADTSDDQGDETIDGVGFGVGAGYDYDVGGVILGVEGEFMESSGSQDSDESIDGFVSSVETGRDLYIGGRVGVPVTDRTLLYAKGGYTNLAVEANYDGVDDDFEFDRNADGFRLGAGIEQAFGTNAYGKLEYRYSNYNNLELNMEGTDFQRDIDLDRHQVVAGVGFRF